MDGIPNAAPGVVRPVDIAEEHRDTPQTPDTPVVDGPATKMQMHQRILQRISRSSSFASISGSSGRARSSSSLYRSSAGPSCISLSPSVTPFASSSSSSQALSSHSGTTTTAAAAPYSTPTSFRPNSPSTTPFPPFPHSVDRCQSSNAIRKVDLTTMAGATGPSTSALPADMARTASAPLLRQHVRLPRSFEELWRLLPDELKIKVLGFLTHKDLVRASRINRTFNKACFDGQLWTQFSAVEFHKDISIESLDKIFSVAGPFLKKLNLRGCVQVQGQGLRTLIKSKCTNLDSVTLEGTKIDTGLIHCLLETNSNLVNLDLKGLRTVVDGHCDTIATYCGKLEVLDLSWCQSLDAAAVGVVISSCHELRDLRIREAKNLGSLKLAEVFYKAKHLECLDFTSCHDLSSEALEVMMHGVDPPRDVFSGKPLTEPRALRLLDISRCPLITDAATKAVGDCAPFLENLILSGLPLITEDGLRPVLQSAANLKTLELDNLPQLTNDILINGIATAPCAAKSLKYLSLSSCRRISDEGAIAVLRACPNLQTLRLDDTAISNQTLLEACIAVRERPPTPRSSNRRALRRRPHVGLMMDIFDCPNITWPGVREVMSQNSRAASVDSNAASNQVIALKCFFLWQQTFDEHRRRVQLGKIDLADRLEQIWVNYMQASDEAEIGGAGQRLRQRRMRQAEHRHADNIAGEAELGDDGSEPMTAGRQRARTATCAVM